MKTLHKIVGLFRVIYENPVLIFIRWPLGLLFLPLDLLHDAVGRVHGHADRFVGDHLLPAIWDLEGKYGARRHKRSAVV